MRALPILMLSSAVLGGLACSDAPRRDPGTPLSPEATRAALSAFEGSEKEAWHEALEQVLALRDARFSAVFIELLRAAQLRLRPTPGYNDLVIALERLSGHPYGSDWHRWLSWWSAEGEDPPPGFVAWKAQLFAQLEGGFERFLHEGAGPARTVAELAWAGIGVDQVLVLDDPAANSGPLLALEPEEPVAGVVVGDRARAYPIRFLDRFEIVNDRLGDRPYVLVRCALCGSTRAYDASSDGGARRRFGASGLVLRGTPVMFDREDDSLWNELTGDAVLDPLQQEGERLEPIPVVLTSYRAWRARHPESDFVELAGPDGKAARTPYAEHYGSLDVPFPAPVLRSDLQPKDWVYTVANGSGARAIELERLRDDRVHHDRVGEQDVVVVTRPARLLMGWSDERFGEMNASPGVEARVYPSGGHRFRIGEAADVLIDEAEGRWLAGDEALVGPDGTRLPILPGTMAFWFAWQAFYPDTELTLALTEEEKAAR